MSGYTGGGKQMIAQMEDPAHPEAITAPHFLYGLPLKHKHVPEMKTHGLLSRAPLFSPSGGRFPQGMIVQVPLFIEELAPGASLASIHAALADHYAGQSVVEVVPLAESAGLARIDATELARYRTDEALRVRNGGRIAGQSRGPARQSGKGASGAAVQNMDLMLGR